MRLFVAIALPEDVTDALSALCSGVPGARWVPPENMHLTLRFIGEVDGGACDDIAEALAAVRGQPFDLTLTGVGHFESRRQPRALWAGLVRSEPLARLRESVESAVQRAGLAPEGRKFAPHVTLARLKDAPADRVQQFLAAHNLFRSRPFPVTGFTLFSSFLSKSGAIYRPEAEFPFEGRGQEDEPGEELYDPWGLPAAGSADG